MELVLRPWKMDDLENLVVYANNYKIARNLTNKFPYPYTEEDGVRFINYTLEDKTAHIFAIEINGEVCGGIGLHPHTDVECKNAELGYWLAEPFWGRGIMTQAIKEIIDYGFAKIDINRIFARPYGSNIGSQKVLEKTGFKLEARFEKTFFKFGEYEDELVYAVRKEDY
ncbi:GNAT family protein [Aquimarina sp. MMG016]|uniref:GNAT family N-acetyltransferase n=1 Tax=Aquimarina sp. MMG016 TaxID=2822690 RepID=UPI001B39CE40|nr:GNAT family protein [Aquimarina sp. MMG016]MBQ4821971.1 GNAT family N-acetyltransferase [Aquimarina sp. MMG016]